MTAFITAFIMVFLAELGDKTQLLVMTFAAKYRWQTVMFAVLFSTILNHLVAILIGIYLNSAINMAYIHIAAAAAFLAFGASTLFSNKREEKFKEKKTFINPFWTVAIAFFLAETGDKTQLAAITIAARFGAWGPLIIGTTLGMVAADSLGVLAGTFINNHISSERIQFFRLSFSSSAAVLNWRIPSVSSVNRYKKALSFRPFLKNKAFYVSGCNNLNNFRFRFFIF